MTNIYPANNDNIQKAAEIIKSGGVAAFPTETVYGLGANAFDGLAAAKIFDIKQRPKFDPLIVHIHSFKQLNEVAADVPPLAKKLADEFWAGALTIVLPKTDKIPDIITSGLNTVAVRMPSNPIARKLIEYADVPIAAPSANRFGCVSPTSAEDVYEQLGQSVPIILDEGRCNIGIESTIISFCGGEPVVLRLGGIAVEDIEKVVGLVKVDITNDNLAMAPGRLLRHYAPQTKLEVYERNHLPPAAGKVGLLCLKADENLNGFATVEELSKSEDLVEAAVNLYAAMRKLDAQNLDIIYAVEMPDLRLGRAINDRLRRASAK